MDGLSPLLSIGSGHAELTAQQPWLGALYELLVQRGVRVLHHELRPGPGVDVAGDLTDARFLRELAEVAVRSVMCCNVLEHVPNPAQVASTIERLVVPGGYVLVSVPRRYPYHPGPIDTLFRPSVDELRRLFPSLTPTNTAEIQCESLLRYWLASPSKWTSLAHGSRLAARRTGGPAFGGDLPFVETARMVLSSTAVSAVILRHG